MCGSRRNIRCSAWRRGKPSRILLTRQSTTRAGRMKNEIRFGFPKFLRILPMQYTKPLAGRITISGKYFALEGSSIYHEFTRRSDIAKEHAREQLAFSCDDIKRSAERYSTHRILWNASLQIRKIPHNGKRLLSLKKPRTVRIMYWLLRVSVEKAIRISFLLRC